MTRQPTCEERIDAELESTREDLERLWKLYQRDPDAYHDDLGNLLEYGLDLQTNLSVDGRVQAQWLLMTGGPHSEINFHADGRITFVYKDWGCVAKRDVSGDGLIRDIMSFWIDCSGIQPCDPRSLYSRIS